MKGIAASPFDRLRVNGVVIAVAVLASGCSIFFDPGKAATPCSASLCPQMPQATARCESGKCAYSCLAGRTDPNGDLGSATGNGCEGCGPAAPPDVLHALVGNPSGGVHWLWNRPDAGGLAPVKFTLCTGAQTASLTNCQTLDLAAACPKQANGFECGVLTTGHANDTRIYGRVQGVNVCGDTEPTGATRGTSPIDGTLMTVLPVLPDAGGDSPCDAGFTRMNDSVKIDQAGACLTALTFGDDAWQDFTLTGQIQLSDADLFAGFAFHYPKTVQKTRSSLMLAPSTREQLFTAAMTTLPTSATVDKVAGASVPPVPPGQWLDVEIVSVNGEVSVKLAPPNSAASEVLRWVEPPGTTTGRFGVYLLTFNAPTPVTVLFQNVQISTRAVLPPRGPSSKTWDWTSSSLPAGSRVVPAAQATTGVKIATCYGYAEAAGCSGACKPAAGAKCVEISHPALLPRTLTFDQPLGLDPAKPWRLSFKFAPKAATDFFAHVLSSQAGGPVIRGPGQAWTNAPVTIFGAASTGLVEPAKWNRFDLNVNVASYQVALNGKAVDAGMVLFPPQGWDPHLGAFTLGGNDFGAGFLNNVEAQWTELEIAQPP